MASKEKRQEFLVQKTDEENMRPVKRIGPRFQADLPPFIGPARSKDVEENIRSVKRIGPRFQAKLPQFVGLARYKSDKSNLKWLGTKIWPVESNQKNDDYALRTTMDLLYDCACQVPITKSSSTRKRQRDEE
ncbi:hypothetical protein ACP275_06G050900 [Erythranthe tilingii]